MKDQNTNTTNSLPKRNDSLTSCIFELAGRASELGEFESATVLYSLVGQRKIGVDYALATVAAEQSKLLLTITGLPNGTGSNEPPKL